MLIKRKSIEKDESRRPASVARKPRFAPVTLSEQDGVRYLHFGTEWVQGAMRVRKPDWLELEYTRQMMAWLLFLPEPSHIVQLGLGAGALTKFCYRQFPHARVTAVELNPEVVAVARSMFKLPPDDERLAVLEMDAMDFVSDPARRASADVLQIDLYDANARGPVIDSADFYVACAATLAPEGMMTVNLFGEHPTFARNLKAMRFAFDAVLCLPPVHEGNVVALAFKQAPRLDFPALYERAKVVRDQYKLPAKPWVDGLKTPAG